MRIRKVKRKPRRKAKNPLRSAVGKRVQREGKEFEEEVAEKEEGLRMAWKEMAKKRKQGAVFVATFGGQQPLFDLLVLEKKGKDLVFRMISCKRSGYIKPKEREILIGWLRMLEDIHEVRVKTEVHWRPSPRKLRRSVVRFPEHLKQFSKDRRYE